jgi:HlyD family secretion protein
MKYLEVKMKKKKIKIGIIVLAGVLVVGVGGFYIYKKLTAKTAVSAASYLTYKAEKKNIEISISGAGTVEAVNTEDVISSSSSTIVSLGVAEGAQVAKGATIATLDSSNLKLDLEKAKADLNQSKLQLTQLQSSLSDTYVKSPVSGTVTSVYISAGDNPSSLPSGSGNNQGSKYGVITLDKDQYGMKAGDTVSFPTPTNQGTITAVYVGTGSKVSKGTKLYKMSDASIQQQIANQKISVESAQNQYDLKKEAYDSSTVTAPISGIVSALNYKTGDSVQNGKAIATITDLTKLQVVVPVDELDISKVKLNQSCNIKIDALSDKTYTGKVTKIANIGTASNSVTTYDVTVALDNVDSIRIGMTANVTVVVNSKADAIVVPLDAVTTRNGKSYVMTALPSGATAAGFGYRNQSSSAAGSNSTTGKTTNSGTSSQGINNFLTEVTLGIQNETQAEIVSGLTEGQTVYAKATTSSSTTATTTKNQGGFGAMGGLTGETNRRPAN